MSDLTSLTTLKFTYKWTTKKEEDNLKGKGAKTIRGLEIRTFDLFIIKKKSHNEQEETKKIHDRE